MFSKQQQEPLFTFFDTLSATRELNSFEEPCITLTVAVNSFARELNPHGGVYIHIYIYGMAKLRPTSYVRVFAFKNVAHEKFRNFDHLSRARMCDL